MDSDSEDLEGLVLDEQLEDMPEDRECSGSETIDSPDASLTHDAYRQLLEELGDEEDPALSAPTFWPAIRVGDRRSEWNSLRAWVEELVHRYPHLDHHVIPRCWYLHNGHVEALVALRDHERISFAQSSPATSPVQWQWAFAQIESRLREWTAHAGCLSTHRSTPAPPRAIDDDAWEHFLARDEEAHRLL
ncbi:hypothetical protein [Ferrimicrobium sp.]|uniref:hypothetical protein n=1 Tax=Ferrimicrobium sp. TaxID=2926050 RepID=UPI002613DF35|nr:hypothetical protein [Ferrimicrobium sp.]